MKRKFSVLVFLMLILFGFRSVPSLIEWPDYFPKPVYNFEKNPLTAAQVDIGRKLFYDPILSLDSSTSCASCHSPYNSFAHVDHKLSHGIYDSIGTRNAPALFNLAWQSTFMWDGAVNNIEVQPLAPITNHIEMNESIEHVVLKLQRSKLYASLFFHAFGDSLITGHNVLTALAQFQLTLISKSSKYDSVMDHTAMFTTQEKNGYGLYQKNCSSCHKEPLFSTYGFASNGLPMDDDLHDYGKFAITHNAKDSFLFKIPSLRNVAYSYPYMHDGRFATLYEVVNYYSDGLRPSTYVSPPAKRAFHFSASEKIDLVAFLLTLSDRKFIFDKQFGPPSR